MVSYCLIHRSVSANTHGDQMEMTFFNEDLFCDTWNNAFEIKQEPYEPLPVAPTLPQTAKELGYSVPLDTDVLYFVDSDEYLSHWPEERFVNHETTITFFFVSL